MKIQYAIIFVSDMEAATAFFRDRLGFPLRFTSPGWTEFATEGATVALHATARPARETPAGESQAGTCRFGFSVPDLDAFHQRMLAERVPCLQPPMLQFGARLAQYTGPDGLVFSVGEARATS